MDFEDLVSDFSSFLDDFNGIKTEVKKVEPVDVRGTSTAPGPSKPDINVFREPDVVCVSSDDDQQQILNSSTDTCSSPPSSPIPAPIDHEYANPRSLRSIRIKKVHPSAITAMFTASTSVDKVMKIVKRPLNKPKPSATAVCGDYTVEFNDVVKDGKLPQVESRKQNILTSSLDCPVKKRIVFIEPPPMPVKPEQSKKPESPKSGSEEPSSTTHDSMTTSRQGNVSRNERRNERRRILKEAKCAGVVDGLDTTKLSNEELLQLIKGTNKSVDGMKSNGSGKPRTVHAAQRRRIIRRAREAGIIPRDVRAKKYSTEFLVKRLEAKKSLSKAKSNRLPVKHMSRFKQNKSAVQEKRSQLSGLEPQASASKNNSRPLENFSFGGIPVRRMLLSMKDQAAGVIAKYSEIDQLPPRLEEKWSVDEVKLHLKAKGAVGKCKGKRGNAKSSSGDSSESPSSSPSDDESDSDSGQEKKSSSNRKKDVNPEPDPIYTKDGYKLFIPKSAYSMTKMSGLVPCEGCMRYFKKGSSAMEVAYYIHCALECEYYQRLELTRNCDNCKRTYINLHSYRCHFESCMPSTHKIPKWMSKEVFRSTFSGPLPVNSSRVECLGCKAAFDSVKVSRGEEEVVNYSIDYFLHVIKYCDEYKKLNLIAKCKDCKCLFLNSEALSIHRKRCTKRKKKPIKRYYDFN